MARRASFGAMRRNSARGVPDHLPRHHTFVGDPAAGMLRGRTASCSSIDSMTGLPGAESMTHTEMLQLVMPKPMGLSEVFLFLEVYRRREGMDRAQIMELESAFDKYDREGQGEMNVMDVGKVLRWLGYAVSFDVQQRLVKEVDVDQSGSLDIAEMRKLARIFREKELLSWSDTFKKRDKAKIGVMSVDACIHTLRAIGIQATPVEVNEIRSMRRPISAGPKTNALSRSSSSSGMSSIDSEDEPRKEQRDGSYRNALPFDQFSELIQKVVKLTRKQQEELYEIFSKIDAATEGGSPKALMSSTDQLKLKRESTANLKGLTVDFPEFLLLMDQLLAMDFAGIRENSERIAENERTRQRRKRMSRKR